MNRAPIAALMFVAGGCASPGSDITIENGDFALLNFRLLDCTSNDEHVGLERFLRSLYGTSPSIDLERGLACVRVPGPTTITPQRIADGFRRANTGLGSFELRVQCTVSQGRVTLFPTGQVLRAEHVLLNDPTPRWRTLIFHSPKSEGGASVTFIQ